MREGERPPITLRFYTSTTKVKTLNFTHHFPILKRKNQKEPREGYAWILRMGKIGI